MKDKPVPTQPFQVKCLDNRHPLRPDTTMPLTVGQRYTVTSESENLYGMINDKGDLGTYFKSRFQKV